MRNKHYWPRYCKFIAYCKARKLNETDYTETHHILPRSLGGNNSKANLIRLTAREHYIAHWILAKSFTKTDWKIKMLKAFGAMCGSKTKRKFTAKQFERAKIAASKARKGKKRGPQTVEHRANISKAKKAKPKTPEHRANLSKPKTAEHRANMSKAQKGKVLSDEQRANKAKTRRAKNSHLENEWNLLKLVSRTKAGNPTAKAMKILKTYFNIKLTHSQCRCLMQYNLKMSWAEYLEGKGLHAN